MAGQIKNQLAMEQSNFAASVSGAERILVLENSVDPQELIGD